MFDMNIEDPCIKPASDKAFVQLEALVQQHEMQDRM